MSRLAAFSCFVWAAFAWPTWGIDRAGLAALGFAFLALTVGRVSGRARPSLFQRRPTAVLEPTSDVDAVVRDLTERIAAYDE